MYEFAKHLIDGKWGFVRVPDGEENQYFSERSADDQKIALLIAIVRQLYITNGQTTDALLSAMDGMTRETRKLRLAFERIEQRTRAADRGER
jgi:hypothetical protein